MTPVLDMHHAVSGFVARGLFDHSRGFGGCKAIGFANDHEGLVAGVVYHNYDPEGGAIELSSYSTHRKWLTKERLRLIFAYPFDQMKCRIAVARISERNTRTLRIWRALGAATTRIPDLRGPNEAEMIAILRADTWHSSKYMKGS